MRNRNTKSWRLLSNKQNPAPKPLADCGTESAFDLDPTCCRCPEYRAALRSLDTTRFHGRSNDPGPPRTQEPHCALADVSPLIKDDEDIIGTFALGRLSDSTRVSMTCPLVRWRDCTSLCLFVQSHANAYGSAARNKMEHAEHRCRSPGVKQSLARMSSPSVWETCLSCDARRAFVRCHNRHPLLHDKHRLPVALTAANQRLSFSTA